MLRVALASQARSFHGRDAPFARVEPLRMPGIAAAAAAAGARHLMRVDPVPAWQQLSAAHLGLSGTAELSIAQLPFEHVTVLRPLAVGGRAGPGWMQRVAHVYRSLQLLMIARSLPALTSAQVARAAVDLLRAPPPGIAVMGAARVAERLAGRAGR